MTAATPATFPRFSRWLWVGLLVLVPLTYNPFSRWQFEPDKVALTLALTGLLAGYTLWRGGLPRSGGGWVERWIAAYLTVRWLSLVTSIAPEWSLWGDPAWRNGLWMTLVGALLFILARRQFITPAQRETAITAILFGSLLVSVIGIWQYITPFTDKIIVRAASSLSHANLLAAYLAMVLPLTLLRVSTVRGRARRWMTGLLVLQLVCLLVTYSRAGWLAAMSGVAVFGLAYLWLIGRRRAAAVLAVGLTVGFVTLLILSLLPPLPGSTPHPLQTATSLFRWKGATAQIRLFGWEGSLDAIRDRPWLGYGPASFRTVIEWTMPPDLAPFHGTPGLGGRTHNAYLETAVESGLIGLVVYLVLLGAILVPLLGAVAGNTPHPPAPSPAKLERGSQVRTWHLIFSAAVLASLVANLVNNVFSFDCATTAVLFWALAGMAHAEPLPARTPTLPRVRWGGAVAVGSVILALWMTVPDMLAMRAEHLAQAGQFAEAVDVYEQAIDLAPTPEVFLGTLGVIHADWAIRITDPAIWARGAAVYDRLVARHPDVAEYHAAQALYLRRWHERGGGEAVAQAALDAYAGAIRLSPGDPDLLLDRGLLRVQMGDLAGALADFEQANTLLPDYRRYYGARAIHALAQGDAAAAEDWNRRALQAQEDWNNWVWRR
jgi:O-antigen ligase/Flp pilus assembly protein TadD